MEKDTRNAKQPGEEGRKGSKLGGGGLLGGFGNPDKIAENRRKGGGEGAIEN